MGQDLKRCSTCTKVLPSSYFESNHTRCVFCEDIFGVSKWQRISRRKRQKYHRNSRLRNIYNISDRIYYQMLYDQNGLCKVCDTANPGTSSGRFVIDHDHVSGVRRGLICHHCNLGLGHFFDNPKIMAKAQVYIYEGKELSWHQ